jgi:hypothetical protein
VSRPLASDDDALPPHAALGSGYLPPETSPDLYRDLGLAYSAANKPQRAVELFERTLADLRERIPDDTGLFLSGAGLRLLRRRSANRSAKPS